MLNSHYKNVIHKQRIQHTQTPLAMNSNRVANLLSPLMSPKQTQQKSPGPLLKQSQSQQKRPSMAFMSSRGSIIITQRMVSPLKASSIARQQQSHSEMRKKSQPKLEMSSKPQLQDVNQSQFLQLKLNQTDFQTTDHQTESHVSKDQLTANPSKKELIIEEQGSAASALPISPIRQNTPNLRPFKRKILTQFKNDSQQIIKPPPLKLNNNFMTPKNDNTKSELIFTKKEEQNESPKQTQSPLSQPKKKLLIVQRPKTPSNVQGWFKPQVPSTSISMIEDAFQSNLKANDFSNILDLKDSPLKLQKKKSTKYENGQKSKALALESDGVKRKEIKITPYNLKTGTNILKSFDGQKSPIHKDLLNNPLAQSLLGGPTKTNVPRISRKSSFKNIQIKNKNEHNGGYSPISDSVLKLENKRESNQSPYKKQKTYGIKKRKSQKKSLLEIMPMEDFPEEDDNEFDNCKEFKFDIDDKKAIAKLGLGLQRQSTQKSNPKNKNDSAEKISLHIRPSIEPSDEFNSRSESEQLSPKENYLKFIAKNDQGKDEKGVIVGFTGLLNSNSDKSKSDSSRSELLSIIEDNLMSMSPKSFQKVPSWKETKRASRLELDSDIDSVNDRVSDISLSMTPLSKNAPISNFGQMCQKLNKKGSNGFGDAYKNFNQLKNPVIQELLEQDEAQSDNSVLSRKNEQENMDIEEVSNENLEQSPDRGWERDELIAAQEQYNRNEVKRKDFEQRVTQLTQLHMQGLITHNIVDEDAIDVEDRLFDDSDLDLKLDVQVFGTDSRPVRELQIDKENWERVGKGGQAEVFKLSIPGIGLTVDKYKKVSSKHKEESAIKQAMLSSFQEFCTGRNLIHPNIMEYLYFKREFDPNSQVHEFHIIMEIMEGKDLLYYIQKNYPFDNIEKIQHIGGQIISGLKYLHDNKIIHKDLKPANILFTKDFKQLKLADMGISSGLDGTLKTKKADIGTVRYLSPELYENLLSFKSDIWAFACVMLELCTGKCPFYTIALDMSVAWQVHSNVTPLQFALDNYPKERCQLIHENSEFRDLLEDCFNIDYQLRPSAEDIFECDFFGGYTTIVDYKLVPQPRNVIDPQVEDEEQILKEKFMPRKNNLKLRAQDSSAEIVKSFIQDVKIDPETVQDWQYNVFISHAEIDQAKDNTHLSINQLCDPPINEMGLKQAKRTAQCIQTFLQKLRRQGFEYNNIEIRSSPFLRSIQTAGMIAKQLKVSTIYVDSLLIKPLTWTNLTNPIPHLIYTKLRQNGQSYDNLIKQYPQTFATRTEINDSKDLFLQNLMNVYPEESVKAAMTRTYMAYDSVLQQKTFVISVTHQENLEWITAINQLMKERAGTFNQRNISQDVKNFCQIKVGRFQGKLPKMQLDSQDLLFKLLQKRQKLITEPCSITSAMIHHNDTGLQMIIKYKSLMNSYVSHLIKKENLGDRKLSVLQYTNCSVCKAFMVQPLMLPCNHRFCLQCIQSQLFSSQQEGKNSECPQCNQEFRYDEIPNKKQIFIEFQNHLHKMYPKEFRDREDQLRRMGLLEKDLINIEFHIGNHHKRLDENEPAMLDQNGKPYKHLWTVFVKAADPRFKKMLNLLVQKVSFYTSQERYRQGLGYIIFPGSTDIRSLSEDQSKHECALTSYGNQAIQIVMQIHFKLLVGNSKDTFRVFYKLNLEEDYTFQKYFFQFNKRKIEALIQDCK